MYANEGNKDPILLPAVCQLYQILSYLLSPSIALKLRYIKTFFLNAAAAFALSLHHECLNTIIYESVVCVN